MRKLIGTATFGGMALAALVACGGTAANATPLTLTGSYTVGESPTIGAPGVGSPKLPSSFTESFAGLNSTVSVASFFTLSPNPSSGNCNSSSPGCFIPTALQRGTDTLWKGTQTDTITVTMNLTFNGQTHVLVETGTFTAKYGGVEASCSDSGGSGSGNDTDCMVWNSVASTIATTAGAGGVSGAGGTVTDQVNFGTLALQLTFINAEDWDITPGITFKEVDPPASAPEPASLAILGLGLLGLTFVSRRRA